MVTKKKSKHVSPLKKQDECITVMGLIVPVAWDDDGRPNSFALFTYDEREFLIDPDNPAGRAVIAMPQQKIKVTGTLGDAVNTRRLLRVKNYEPVPASGAPSKD